MEWSAPGIILAAAAHGEGGALVSIFTEQHGIYRGLAHGGFSRAKANIYQPGNLVAARWMARLADQLGSLSAELVHPAAALAMEDAWSLSVLSSACATALGALPERTAHPAVFRGLLHLIAHLPEGEVAVAALVRWEAGLLRELGYGLTLESCAVTGATEGLAFVSPRTGGAVAADAAGEWAERLLALPPFLLSEAEGNPAEWADGLRLTGHFLARAFAVNNQPLPAARLMLQDRAARRAAGPGG